MPVKKQDAIDDLLRVLHFLNRLCVVMISQLFEPPVETHLGVDEVRVDRRQLDGQAGVQRLNDLFVSFHVLMVDKNSTVSFFGKGEINTRRVAIKPNTDEKKRSLLADIET